MKIVKRIFWSLVAVVAGCIPIELYLLARLIFEPSGFWQNFALTGVAFCFMGVFQLLLLVILAVFLLFVWTKLD